MAVAAIKNEIKNERTLIDLAQVFSRNPLKGRNSLPTASLMNVRAFCYVSPPPASSRLSQGLSVALRGSLPTSNGSTLRRSLLPATEYWLQLGCALWHCDMSDLSVDA